MNNFKIGLTFSGGGFRAAAFNLGVLSYLETIPYGDTSLLKHVMALSTVSGGTVTGARYAVGVKNGEDFLTFYKNLYAFMETDLVALALDRLASRKGWGNGRVKSLINAFADVYDGHLFTVDHTDEQQKLAMKKFGTLMRNDSGPHLKHVSFNATDFSHALQFRFQWSERDPALPDEPERGIIGNYYYNIPEDAAREIRMADILAASSCFPGGFEPINFPSDFISPFTPHLGQLGKLPQTDLKPQEVDLLPLDKLTEPDKQTSPKDEPESEYPVGLMDGGIVDNQGIEPVLLVERRLRGDKPDNAFDLIIISDVASPFMEGYKQSVQQPENWWRRLTPGQILFANGVLLLAATVGIVLGWRQHNNALLTVSAVLGTCSFIVFLLGRLLKSLPLLLQVPASFMKPLGKLLQLTMGVYETLISNRANSVLKMVTDVFLKHVRRLNYRIIYEDRRWINRRITNTIYELGTKGLETLKKKIKNGTLSPGLEPTQKVSAVADKAASMGTTLWFTENQLKIGMLNDLVACGQFTLCWNLLEYIDILEKNSTNTTDAHKQFIGLKERLLQDWDKFQNEPHHLVTDYKSGKVKFPPAAPAIARQA